MDSFFLSVVDGIFFLVGRGFLWSIHKIKLPFPEIDHWATVVLGVVLVVCLCVVAIFVF